MNDTMIRPYEISVWTLQDGFLSVLKPYGGSSKGQLITPKFSLQDNTATLDFSIPMYYRDNKGDMVINPLWYNTQNGILVANLRKIKVILNKGEIGEGIFEFLIHKVKETHKGGELFCEVSAEWLPFEELGKIGYKLSLNYDTYLTDLDKQNEEEKEDFLPTLNYWADKIFTNTNWDYSIQMDWSSYDGVIDLSLVENQEVIFNYEKASEEEREELNLAREARGLRRRDKLYEEEYVSSWSLNVEQNKLVPKSSVAFQEKARLFEIEKSNIYNITQELAELFGVFVKYKYYYDDNYHIIKRECIFYNTYLDEQKGKFDINYSYQSSEIIREIESNDIITKMYVPTTEDNSIISVKANKSKEDYILNFDYSYSIGTITEEQYSAIEPYQLKMYKLNSDHELWSDKKSILEREMVKLKAEQTTLTNSITYATEQISEADALLNSITSGTGLLYKTETNPEMVMILKDNDAFKINLTLEGIDADTIRLFAKMKDNTVTEEIIKFDKVYDTVTGKNIVGLTNIDVENPGRAYIVCAYSPRIKYENIKEIFITRCSIEQPRLDEVNLRLKEIEGFVNENEEAISGEYDEVINNLRRIEKEQQNARADFDRMMGPALREGSWEAEDQYLEYEDKNLENDLVFRDDGSELVRNNIISTLWDTELFEGEERHYTEGLDLSKNYRTLLWISNSTYNFLIKKDALKNPVIRYQTNNGIENQQYKYLSLNSGFIYSFLKSANNVELYAMIMDNTVPSSASGFQIGKVTYENNNIVKFEGYPISAHLAPQGLSICYPRICFKTVTKLKTSSDKLVISQNDTVLKEYFDYSLISRDTDFYITIKNNTFINKDLFKDGRIVFSTNLYDINYVISTSDLNLYLDALEVAKTNAYPKVSYTISVEPKNRDFIKYSYLKLNRVANINDSDLMLENVQGYISGIEMDLDKPWEDTFTVKNYKTKFEDLFSRIVASTESLRQNQVSYDRAGSAFTSSGNINPSIIQNTLNSVDLNYSFNNGTLTIDEMNGIWAASENGIVAMRGGGIFCATQKDIYGNWLWNTGITPQGINASLLNAGTIDTNLIRIYSNGNLRFQMNGEGLFAYEGTLTGETNYDKYVVHNSEGLFLTERNIEYEDIEGIIQTEDINLVEVSWEGLILRNRQNEKVFFADPDTGNLEIKGNITAASGNIGKWFIDDKGLISEDESSFLYAEPAVDDTTGIIFRAGKDFSVSKDGFLTATSASIKGTLSAGTLIETSGGNINLNEAVQRIEVVSVGAGHTFKRHNSNYDGNYIEEPNSLRFQIIPRNIIFDKEENNFIQFSYDGETFIPMDNSNFKWDDQDLLTFIVNINFMIDANGSYLSKKDVIIHIKEKGTKNVFETTLSLNLEDKDQGKSLSNINPINHNFTSNDSKQTFEIELIGFSEGEKGAWSLNGNELKDINPDGTVTISASQINGASTLRYEINGVSREALITKVITPKNNITLVIESSDGTLFKNGNTKTTLRAALYENGTEVDVEGTNYGYLWKEIESSVETIFFDFRNQKEINLTDRAFDTRATYICEIYSSQDSTPTKPEEEMS